MQCENVECVSNDTKVICSYPDIKRVEFSFKCHQTMF